MVMQRISKTLQKVFGSRNDRVLKHYWQTVEQVKALEPKYQQMPDGQLRLVTDQFKERLAGGENISNVLPDAFAAMREASDRHLGVRNVFKDEYGFDKNGLPESAQTVFDQLKAQLESGTSLVDLDVPVEFNTEVRKLYPESRPPFRFRHFDVQVIGGNVLSDSCIAEMATGEGKTLVSTLAAYLTCLSEKHVHVITVNDYLAKRDADWMTPVYNALGLTVGAIQADMDTSGQNRKDQYACNITYGTNNEFGFDYLRDNMKMYERQMAQGPLQFAIIDEVDSILIDEARTPLIISGPAQDDVTRYTKADGVARQLMQLQNPRTMLQKKIDTAERTIAATQGELAEAKRNKDSATIEKAQNKIHQLQEELEADEARLETMTEYYEVEPDRKAAHLTHDGIGAAQDIAGVGSFYTGSNMEWPHMLEQSLRAHVTFEREKDYVVLEGKVVIVDEFTGRLMHGRQWSDGLHQAVEAKEGVKVKEETQTLATITLQNFFKLYEKLSGMTGTAETEADEFVAIYGLDVVVIPTNRPCIRDDKDDLIYITMREKFNAIVEDIFNTSSAGRPVLVGTVSIEKSEALSKALDQKYGLEHEVLNAKQHQREAVIVEKAGQQHARRDGKMVGNVTIATNMAGRGTDIKLGTGVAEIGGLHIVGTERHEARRIDNQLRGRAGRQGDNGSSVFFLSFDDDLMQIYGGDRVKNVLARINPEEGTCVSMPFISKQIEKTQKKVEERNYEARKSLLEYDEVMDFQRKYFYTKRRQIIDGHDLNEIIKEMISSITKGACETFLSEDYPASCIAEWSRTTFGVELKVKDIKNADLEEIEEYIKTRAKKTVSNEIEMAIGEYLEDYEDRKSWHLDSLSKWVMSTFGANISVSKLRQMDYDEILKAITEAACEQVDKKDCSPMGEYTKEGFATQRFAEWLSMRFDIKIGAEDIKEENPDKVHKFIVEKIAEKYQQRQIEYPVEFAMNMVFGPEGPNVYGFESMANWANKRFATNYTPEELQEIKPQQLYDKLIEHSKEFYNGGIEKQVDEKIASLDTAGLVQWANDQLGAKLAEQDIADDPKKVLVKAGIDLMRKELSDLERYVLLNIYDSTWKDHLYSMDHLKESIFMRAYAEKDPKIEYKHESHRMFNEMLDAIEDRVTNTIFKVRLDPGQQRRNVWNATATKHDEVGQFSQAERQRAAATAPQQQGPQVVKQIVNDTPKVGRNEPCPCGSGKKYKKCCGKND